MSKCDLIVDAKISQDLQLLLQIFFIGPMDILRLLEYVGKKKFIS